MIRHRRHHTPIGLLTLTAGPDGLLEIRWPDGPVSDGPVPDEPVSDEPVSDGPVLDAVLDRAVTQLDEYFAGSRRTFDLPLAPVGTPFQLAAWDVLRRIPYGATITYRDQARALGDPAKARAVGSANGRNPLPIVVPCHRVCASGGGLGGFTGGLDLKRWLLDHERRTVAAGTVPVDR